MINLDMVGYSTAESDNHIVHIIKYNNSQELTDMAVEFAELYTELIPYTSTQYNMQSDSYSYNSYGVRSVFLSEYEFTPHYHTERDLFSTLNYDYLREQTRLATALVYECSVNNAYGTVSVQDITEVESIDLQILSSSSDNEIKFRVSGLKNRADVSLIDLYGRKIAQIHLKDTENIYSMPKNGLKSGIYILKLESNNQAISKKITLF